MMVAEPHPNVNEPPPPSDIRRDAQIEARLMGTDALLVWREVLALDLASPDENYPGEVGRYLASERMSAVDDELSRRERLVDTAPHLIQANTRTHEAWCELARTLRERVDLPETFHMLVGSVRPVGRNGRRGSPEYAAGCPLCGGTDRLRLWAGPDGRAWCRQCGWSVDVVGLAQSFAPGCSEFREAVKWLAAVATAGVA